MERRNASTLLDRVLEAGRGDEIALGTEEARRSPTASSRRMVAAVACVPDGLGVQREQRVLMVLDDSPAFHATFLGAMRIGAVPVPVNPMDRVDNYVYYLEDSYAKRAGGRGRAAAEARGDAGRRAPDSRCRRRRRHGSAHAASTTSSRRRRASCRRRRTRTRTTWRSGSTARARPGGRRASSTASATSASTTDTYGATSSDRPRTTSATRRRSCTTPTASATGSLPAVGRGRPPCSSRAGRGRRPSSRPSSAHGRRCSSRCRRCTRRWSGRPGRGTRLLVACAPACRPPSRCRPRCSAAGRHDRRADPRRHRLHRDAPHLLLQHAEDPQARPPAGPSRATS